MRHPLSGRLVRQLLLAAALSVPAAALLAPVAEAQTRPVPPAAAPAAKPSAAQLQLARDLVTANGESRAFDGVIPNIVDGAALSFLQTNPDLAKQLREVAVLVRPEFEKRQAEVIDILANSYATRFTEAELKEAIAFYRSSTGIKLVQDRPVIVQEAVQGIQAWGAQINAQAMERVRAEMKKRGVDL
ncbi:hypothetical protein GGQ86_003812 [Xanthobacter flavus]|uniref:DUF2059 domain-containing protein n=1 Tax=Xanthobacter flavus TaxID=281 RepID=A0A9W6CRP1_XANFL|nr:DUF2059 domain-containing protein [Xanthobacter flavus]MBN8916410.1 DUF2059 domain-containing protein [Hyphomicrobiales bacterium]MDR6335317.1 hypothetical protein [Xanthobacter flavus]GLI24129.1 hypothetical protein XFLAVUS301_38030 [Xanthobacter flavus]